MMAESRASSLLDLPAEIRLQILRYLLIKHPEQRDGDRAVVISPLSDWTGRDASNNQLSSQILRTHRAIYMPGREILYTENIFELNGDDVWVFPNFLSTTGPVNVSRIRHLRLDHRHAGYVDCRGSPHHHDQGMVYVNGWLRDLWVDRLFENFVTLRHLETLTIAVDLPSKKMQDSIARLETRLYFEESGLMNKLMVAKLMGDSSQFWNLHDQVILYINKLGILRAATSLNEWCPSLNKNVYYGSWEHGAYGIFSTKALETLASAKERKKASQLCAVSLRSLNQMWVLLTV
jgi:hypothetical protein